MIFFNLQAPCVAFNDSGAHLTTNNAKTLHYMHEWHPLVNVALDCGAQTARLGFLDFCAAVSLCRP